MCTRIYLGIYPSCVDGSLLRLGPSAHDRQRLDELLQHGTDGVLPTLLLGGLEGHVAHRSDSL